MFVEAFVSNAWQVASLLAAASTATTLCAY